MLLAHIDSNTKKEQTLREHCLAVSELCRIYGSKIGFAETSSLSGLIHDQGKATKIFDEYLRYSASHPEDKSKKGSINHSSSAAQYIYKSFYSGDIYQQLTAQILALVVCSHHSGLSDIIGENGIDIFKKRLYPDRDIHYEESINNFFNQCIDPAQVAKKFYNARDEIISFISKMKEQNIFNSFTLHLAVKYIFSCLIDADRLDTYKFMGGENTESISCNAKKLWCDLASNLENALSKLNYDSKLHCLRKEISEACKAFGYKKPGIYRLYVPTGGGKTLSSLRYALTHININEFNKERIIYVIPFTTIIEQNAQAIKNTLLDEKLKEQDIILEHHSNVIVDNRYEDHKLLTERWNSPIILTTLVQFLNTLFSDGTQDVRRLHNLANSVIILDEIQCVPIKCIHLLNGALNFLSKLCNATIILCTATQPPLSDTTRPLMISSQRDIIDNIEEKFLEFKRVELIDRCIPGGYDMHSLADLTLQTLSTVDNCLVVLNTKATARNLYLRLEELNSQLPEQEKINLYHLSTSMCPAHRTDKLNEIKLKLGKERIICVSTQLIEAGVDISFQSVIRALAGFDNIAQAAGRCNRHGEEEEQKKVYIVNIKDEELSSLPEIRIGKACSQRVLNEFKSYPEIYGKELLSPKVMDIYYQYYYNEVKDKMDFNVIEENMSIYDLLSSNSKNVSAYSDRENKAAPYPLKQAFETAGSHFSVIDNKTTSVIVPYKIQGRDLIQQLNGNCGLDVAKRLIRKSQQYIVNLFDYELSRIGQGVYPLMNGGVLALMEEYYDEDKLGVIKEGGQKEFLSI